MDQNTIIYVIGVGNLVDDAFLTNIATIGHGLYFKSPTTADLQAAFTSVAQQAHISLTR